MRTLLIIIAISACTNNKFSDEEKAACLERLEEHQVIEDKYFKLVDKAEFFNSKISELAMQNANIELIIEAQVKHGEAMTRRIAVGNRLSAIRAEMEPLGCFDDSRYY